MLFAKDFKVQMSWLKNKKKAQLFPDIPLSFSHHVIKQDLNQSPNTQHLIYLLVRKVLTF